MLVSNDVYKNNYVGNGTTTEFSVTFPFLDNSHVAVFEQIGNSVVQITTGLTVTGAGIAAGGKVTFATPPAAGKIIAIVRNVPITQLYQYTELDNWPAESFEDSLAKLTMICQQLAEELARAIKVDITSTETPDDVKEQLLNARDQSVASAAAAANSEAAAANSASDAEADKIAASASAAAAANSATAAANTLSSAVTTIDASKTSAVNAVLAQQESSKQAVVQQQNASVAAVITAGQDSIAQTTALADAAANTLESAVTTIDASKTTALNAITAQQSASVSAVTAAGQDSIAQTTANAATASSSVAQAQAWAESPTSPDPADSTKKSAKRWAEQAGADVTATVALVTAEGTKQVGLVAAEGAAQVARVNTLVTTVPAAGGIPQADSNGKLALGWLPSTFLASGIVMFSGTFGGTDGKRPIPVGATDADEGWALCDGSNGTPDLRGRFIVGTGGDYAQGATGGAASASVSGTTGPTTLTIEQIPAHRHSVYTQSSNSGQSAIRTLLNEGLIKHRNWSYILPDMLTDTGGSQAHSHSMSGAVNTLPPYYALAYIMKLPTATDVDTNAYINAPVVSGLFEGQTDVSLAPSLIIGAFSAHPTGFDTPTTTGSFVYTLKNTQGGAVVETGSRNLTSAGGGFTFTNSLPMNTALTFECRWVGTKLQSVDSVLHFTTISAQINAPIFTAPVAGASVYAGLITAVVQSPALIGDTHVSTTWRLKKTADNSVLQEALNSNDLLTHNFTNAIITAGTQCYVEAVFNGQFVSSAAGSSFSFTVKNIIHGEILYGTDGTTPKAVIVGSYSSGGTEPWNIRGNRVWLAVGLASTRGVSIPWGADTDSSSTTNNTDISTITNVSRTNNILASSNTAADGTGNCVSSLSTEAQLDTAMSNPVKNSSELTSAILAYNSGMKAALYCRGVTLKDLGAMDLPSIDALMRIYQSRDIIDSLDPTASANPSKKLSQSTWGFGSSFGSYVWSSSESSSHYSWYVYSGGHISSYLKCYSCGCIAVKEIPA